MYCPTDNTNIIIFGPNFKKNLGLPIIVERMENLSNKADGSVKLSKFTTYKNSNGYSYLLLLFLLFTIINSLSKLQNSASNKT